MSRDWTPQELHQADIQMGFSAKKLAGFCSESGEEIVLYDPECKTAKQYPNLYFLFREGTARILETYGNRAEPVLAELENDLVTEINGCGSNPALHAWYEGKLDPNFYYGETNHRLFEEYIAEKIEKGEKAGGG